MDFYDFLWNAGFAATILHALASRRYKVKASAGLLYPPVAWLISIAPVDYRLSTWEVCLYGLLVAAFVLLTCHLVDKGIRRKDAQTKK